jgi:hypothetical protein
MNKTSLMNAIRLAAFAAMAAIPGMCQCSYSVSAQPVGSAGGAFPVYVNTQPGCAWQISHAGAFLSYYGGRSGNGSGVVYLSATPDRAGTRTAPVYAQRPYTYSCGIGGRSIQYCTGWTNAAGTTAVQY